MSRCIDADALLDEVMDHHCNDCDRRKGIKNGKYRIIYSIGEAPCRACDVDDLKGEIEDAPTIEPRCETCEAFNKTRLLIPQPERKKGKWNFIGDQMFECSECGTYYTQSQFHQMRVRISDTEFPKFCPNCGARMEGE